MPTTVRGLASLQVALLKTGVKMNAQITATLIDKSFNLASPARRYRFALTKPNGSTVVAYAAYPPVSEPVQATFSDLAPGSYKIVVALTDWNETPIDSLVENFSVPSAPLEPTVVRGLGSLTVSLA